MSKSNSNHGFISLLYSIGDNPLALWSKYISPEGRIRRLKDETLNGDKVIEIRGPDNSPIITNISCPASPLDCLNIKLPVLVIILKNLNARVRIDLQIIDAEGIRRKFIISTYEVAKKGPNLDHDTARIYLKLEDDWNSLEIDLRHWCQAVCCTEYIALQRLIIYQNCRLRRIYLQDRHYEPDEEPIQLCQAFFDMYMLKWGINFVEKSCQTNVACRPTKIDESFSLTEISIARDRNSAITLPIERLTESKKSLPTRDKSSAVTKDDFSNVCNGKIDGKSKRSRGSTTTKKKVSAKKDGKSPSRDKMFSGSLEMDKNIRDDDPNEGQIFRKWPYAYLQLQDNGQTTKLKQVETINSSMRSNSVSDRTKCPNSVNSKNSKISTTNKRMISIDFPAPPEVEQAAAAENGKIVDSTRSKLLTTDEALRDFLELRHVVNRRMLENFRSRGLTMTEVELSVFNTTNRQNSFGQGSLVEKHRITVDEACNVVLKKEEPIQKRGKSATN